jgi:non-heme chloroperoxidase
MSDMSLNANPRGRRPHFLAASCLALSSVVGLGSLQVCWAEPAALMSALLKLSSGVTLHYVTRGPADGEPLVLLHGVGDSWHSWDLVFPLLPQNFRIYAVTLRGHGWSDKPPAGYTVDDFAADISQFLEQLQIRNATLVGHSLGSFVAQRVAENDRDGRIERLVLVGSGPGGPRDEKNRQEVVGFFKAVPDPVDPGFARDFQASTAYASLPANFFETMAGEVLHVPARVFHELADAIGKADNVAALARIKASTLVLWGDRDGMLTRHDQDVLVSKIAGARLVVYPDTGHALHWERPEAFAKDLLSFVGEKGRPAR